MDETDGLEFLAGVREAYPELPFILFTGKGSEEIASEAINAGVTDYLQKGGSEQYERLANRVLNAVEQYRARQEAERTRKRMSELTDNASDALWILNDDFTEVIFHNEAYESMYGAPNGGGNDLFEVLHPDDRQKVKRANERVANGRTQDIEYRIRGPSGDVRWIWASAEPVFEDGEVVRIVGFSRDITDRKEREMELKQYKEVFEKMTIEPC